MMVSVVTVNLNHASGLDTTLQSVAMQTYSPLEHIVVDGGSTDGSLAVIARYPHITRWVSEPDAGIYAAQNKGWRMAKGSYILFLNSGDRLSDAGTLALLAAAVQGPKHIVYGNKWVEQPDGTRWLKEYPSPLPPGFFECDTLPHPCTLVPMWLLRKTGGYDERLLIVADWKLFREAALRYRLPMVHVPQASAIFEPGGLSARPESMNIINEERESVKKAEWTIWRRIRHRLQMLHQ